MKVQCLNKLTYAVYHCHRYIHRYKEASFFFPTSSFMPKRWISSIPQFLCTWSYLLLTQQDFFVSMLDWSATQSWGICSISFRSDQMRRVEPWCFTASSSVISSPKIAQLTQEVNYDTILSCFPCLMLI